MKEKALISACLIGTNCKYNGKNNALEDATLKALSEKYELIPVCPEAYGGLTTPRTPSERRGDRVVTADGIDVTEQFRKGANETLQMAQLFGVKLAILKENSPSCGCGTIYDGTFSLTLTAGDGVTAELLKKHGITVIGESKLKKDTL